MLIAKAEGRIEQYLNFLEKRAYRKLQDLRFEVFETDKTLRSPPENAEWKPISAPAPWGKEWACCWFRAKFRVPSGIKHLFLSALPNADSLVFLDGKPFGAFNLFHKKVRINADGKNHILHIEAYSGHYHGGCGPFEGTSIVVTIGKTLPAFPNIFDGGFLLERLPETYGLFYDAKTLYETAKELETDSLRRAKLISGVYNALMEVSLAAEDTELEKQAAAARKLLLPLLSKKNSPTMPRVHIVGGAHIDHAWLWHIGETERKVARTYSNMLAFIEEYPEFVFLQSQPCQLDIARREYPAVFERVQKAFKKGAWEPNGGMWVEADCNIPSGESLIRQFLVGKGATKEMFGGKYEADTLWLPDVFGYSAALPQILAGCRIKYFVTSKISWNDTTRFPYDTFIWRGLDGTGIKTHFITRSYNARVSPAELNASWKMFQHKETQEAFVLSIGEGDGGGGTLRSDLEMARRLTNLEGAPKTAWKKVSAALDDIFETAGALPEWRGELYLELHRGTYTTQSRTKRNNRKLEFALRGTEFLSTAAFLDKIADYPYDALLASWKRVLTNQFHDIIPGSSIGRVYKEAEAQSAQILAELDEISGKIRRSLLGADKSVSNNNEKQERAGSALIVNTLSWERRGIVTIPEKTAGSAAALKAEDGEVYPIERYTGIDGAEMAAAVPALPPLGWARFALVNEAPKLEPNFSYKKQVLQTPFYAIRFDKTGAISSLFDKKQDRELAGGLLNTFVIAEDVPVFWDAWDIDADWTRHKIGRAELLSTTVVANGSAFFRLRREYNVGAASKITQDMVCYSHSPRIDFETKIDWQEKWKLLKAEFNTVFDMTEVRCETQYGYLKRGTHRNLMQDRARFEICAHKWIALEEAGAGIALLNDCKYGHDVEGGRMRLTLLRSPIAPDPDADRGLHYFTYSLYPFCGSFAESGLVQSAYDLNAPPEAEFAASVPSAGATSFSFCQADNPAVIIECVKAPEDRAPNTAILRLYESLGGAQKACLTFGRGVKSAFLTDMLEDNGSPVNVNGAEISLSFRPFEIKTLRVRFD